MRTWLCVLLWGCPPVAGEPVDSDEPTEVEDAVTMKVVGFNTESGGSVPEVVAEMIGTIEDAGLWGFSEVEDEDAAMTYASAAEGSGQAFDYVFGTTGGDDRLVLAWDDAVFELEDWTELDDINVGGTVRAPLVGTLRHRDTDTEFLFMVNHLWRGDDDKRHEQAELLNAWGSDQDLPVIAVGDYNFDYEVEGDERDVGFDLLTDDDVFVWVEPETRMATQCSGYGSILDFTFVAGEAKDWPANAEIVELSNAYCDDDDDERSDHAPVIATFELPD